MQFDEYYKNPAESVWEIFGSLEKDVEYLEHDKGKWVYETASWIQNGNFFYFIIKPKCQLYTNVHVMTGESDYF